jgi:hypothetical protein
VQIDARLVARATGAVAARIAAGIGLGIAIGVIAFLVETVTGLLDASGWWGRASWLLLPLYAVGCAAGLGLIGFIKGKRRAAVILLVDSGLVAEMTRRAIAQSEVREPPATGLVAWAKRFARDVVAAEVLVLRASGDAIPQVNDKVREQLDEWGEITVIVTLILLVIGLAAAPIAHLLA